MNAVEFVQKHGFGNAKVCLLNCACPEDRWFMRQGDLIADQDFDDLKRLVESWELVKSKGGLEKASEWVEKTCFPLSDDTIRLKRAVYDVESVGGGV